jgi:hypothetical protein
MADRCHESSRGKPISLSFKETPRRADNSEGRPASVMLSVPRAYEVFESFCI